MPSPRPGDEKRLHEAFMRAAERIHEQASHEMKARESMRAEYRKAGFEVVARGQLKDLPFIDVKVTVAKVDHDFYDRGDTKS